MPRYYFHVGDGESDPDLQGTVLPDLAAARTESLRFAGALLAEINSGFWSGEEWTMRVTDASDLTLFTLLLTASNAASTQGK